MVRPGARAASAEPADADAFHDWDELRGVAPLARSDQQGQRSTAAFTSEMDFAGQSAPGASESLVGAVLPRRASFPRHPRRSSSRSGSVLVSPASRGVTLTMDQSMRPSASASARTDAKSLSHVPSADQRLCRS
ncbi:hypothetical protein DF19_42120 [Streptomyces olindensis]|nr:hypothetical protein DF19_42120 [Streptomyces olindensis]